jgi:site-specific recombinase XerD
MIRVLRPRSFHEYLSLPILGPILDAFTQWSHQCGYTLGTIRNQLKDIRHLIALFQQQGLLSLSTLNPEDFDGAYRYFHKNHPEIAGTTRQLQKFLEQTHRLPQPVPIPQTRSNQHLSSFSDYLKQVRGLSGTTIRAHLRYLDRFLNSIGFEENETALPFLDVKQLQDFLVNCSKKLNRYSLQHVAGYLRSFLRFEYSRGVLSVPLYEMIDTPRIYRLEKLPRSLAWTTVNNLLLSIDRTDAHGRRDYAMLFLIASYGLRSCEVVSLTLDDINWRSGTISIRQGKTDNEFLLPLTDAVANALIDYVKNGRPHLPYREVFLRIRAPQGRLKPTAVTEAFQCQVRKSGLNIPYQGPHCLRHSYAVHLLRQGTSVKVIGDVLGHRDIESTCVYLRLAIDDLRGVALEVPTCQEENILIDVNALNNLPSAKLFKKTQPSMPSQSFLAEEITTYLKLHHSLGKFYRIEKVVLHSLDAFLVGQYPDAKELDGKIFNQWCQTFNHLTPTVRRNHMRIVRNFCIYRRRFSPQNFVPDMITFPANHAKFIPYIFSSTDLARILSAARQLPVSHQNHLRSEVIRLAIILLYTSGLRRGELLRLTIGDYHPDESTLLIRPTKFHKERVIPLSKTADFELRAYCDLRKRMGIPMNESAPVIWNNSVSPEGKAYTGTGLLHNFRLLCASLKILTHKGIPPRIHDIRHSFAVNALLRWYHDNENVLVKLPQLSTYMGHVSIVSTQCYLPFIEPLRSAASGRFEQKYGDLITDVVKK